VKPIIKKGDVHDDTRATLSAKLHFLPQLTIWEKSSSEMAISDSIVSSGCIVMLDKTLPTASFAASSEGREDEIVTLY